jgi:ornithine carbamoyltransferase
MHCLPADISGVSCVEGEVSKNVFDKYRLATYAEASYKPFVIASLIALTRMKNPAEHMKHLVERSGKRVG